jgi:2-polyprenyl-6-methoxyphenol hydroxylase-like FAD-dependent oxidoreductase
LPGGRLYNTYRGQLDAIGRPVLPGLFSVGDAVCTTTPLAGRGVALALMQARELARILDLHDRDITTATKQFDRWTRGTFDRGSTTTATPTPIGCVDGPAGTLMSAVGCRPT